ncbi:MAG: putative protein kinase [Friedmanniella sp.]|nr:putative protein kinase [Friedmanniella sp.]
MTATTPYRKRVPGRPPDVLAVEAAGLRWLADAGPAGAAVVEVLDLTDAQLTLRRLTPVRPTRAAAADLGVRLAATHASGAAAFGQPPAGLTGDGYIGTQPLTLRPAPTWGAFFAAQRVLPYARRARDLGHLSRDAAALVDRVAARLTRGEFDDEAPPRRLHGDLWSGNVMFTAAGAVLIDPAAHGGHGLTDLALLHLFGLPELESLTVAYADAAALEPGYRALIGLHQLHPLLVHAVTHGAAYGAEAARVALRYA